jgi:rhodanese-related sulfurtransferase
MEVKIGVIKTIILNFLLSIIISVPAFAKNSPNVISAPEVKQMMESGNATIIHVLSHMEYLFQHIPGSINIPVDLIASSTRLPEDKNKPVVFYCMGLR